MSKPLASLSLDLDNLWSYQKIHGDEGWEELPSYLDRLVPRVLDLLASRNLRITVFIVGQDAAEERNHASLRAIADAGHEIGNHSFHHEPWMLAWDDARVTEELVRAEDAIEAATGQRPRGFRGPGFALSDTILSVLHRRGYLYDCSTFPTVLGPIARAYYFMQADLSDEEKAQRATLFGGVREGLRSTKAYRWRLDGGELLEIPVTVMPLTKVPIHVSYLMYLAQFSPLAAHAYFRAACALCRATGTELSLLLHPLDFLGGDECPELAFFPAMGMSTSAKLRTLDGVLGIMSQYFEIVPMALHAQTILVRGDTPVRRPRFKALDPSIVAAAAPA